MEGYATGATIPTELKGYWDFESLNDDGFTFPNRGNWSYDYMTNNNLFMYYSQGTKTINFVNYNYVRSDCWKTGIISFAGVGKEQI